ncbi:MAG: tetratricopeptide repeat-containing sensor histidine kinase [Bacteroidota bacterium]
MRFRSTVGMLLACFPSFIVSQQAKVDSLHSVLSQLRDTSKKAQALADLAEAYLFVNADSCLSYATRALHEASVDNVPVAKIIAHHALGQTYQTKARPDSASYHLLQALKLSDSIEHKPLEIKSLELLAVSKEKINYESAMRYLLQALEISEKIDVKEGAAAILHRIGTLYFHQGKYQQALTHFIRSKELWDHVSPLKTAGINSEIGNVYYRLKDYSSALAYYERSLAINRQIGDLQGMGYSFNNVGLALYKLGEKKKALQALEQSLRYRVEVDSKEGISNSYINLAEYYLAEGDVDKALMYAQKNLTFVQSSNVLNLLADAYNILAKVYTQRKDFERAYRHHLLYTQLSDSINNVQQMRNLSELQVLYETQQKEAENARLREQQAKHETVIQRQNILTVASIILFAVMALAAVALFRANRMQTAANKILQQQNDIIERQRAQLEEANAVKDKLFSILTHDLYGPITSLKTFLSLADDEEFSRKELHEYIRMISSSVETIIGLMENVLRWSQSQWQGIVIQPATINLHDIANECLRLLKPHAQHKGITLFNDIPPATYAFADHQMIDLVVRNLLSNAVKFTSAGGSIRIRAVERNDSIDIVIEDTGVGIRDDQLNRLFSAVGISTTGTDNEQGAGLGLILCKEFIEKNGGTLHIDSEPGKGTTVTFSLPRVREALPQERSTAG